MHAWGETNSLLLLVENHVVVFKEIQTQNKRLDQWMGEHLDNAIAHALSDVVFTRQPEASPVDDELKVWNFFIHFLIEALANVDLPLEVTIRSSGVLNIIDELLALVGWHQHVGGTAVDDDLLLGLDSDTKVANVVSKFIKINRPVIGLL